MKNVLKKIVGTVAPVLATALGGPLGGTALKAIADALGIEMFDGETHEQVEERLAEKLALASPDTLLQLKKVEADLMVKMEELGISAKRLQLMEEEIHQKDRDSARQREIARKDYVPAILAFSTFGLFGLVLIAQVLILYKQIPVDPNAVKVLDVGAGILMASVTSVLTYYFGSSAGSKAKTDIMSNGRK